MDSFKNKVKIYIAINLKAIISELCYFTTFYAIWRYKELKFEFCLLEMWRISKSLVVTPIATLADFTRRTYRFVSSIS